MFDLPVAVASVLFVHRRRALPTRGEQRALAGAIAKLYDSHLRRAPPAGVDRILADLATPEARCLEVVDVVATPLASQPTSLVGWPEASLLLEDSIGAVCLGVGAVVPFQGALALITPAEVSVHATPARLHAALGGGTLSFACLAVCPADKPEVSIV
jgi:hypothetical protein